MGRNESGRAPRENSPPVGIDRRQLKRSATAQKENAQPRDPERGAHQPWGVGNSFLIRLGDPHPMSLAREGPETNGD